MIKKKLTAGMLSIVLAAGVLSYSTELPALNNKCFAANQGLIGDLNGDNVINSVDGALMKRYMLGTITHFQVSDDLWSGDLNGDGSINSIDYSLLKRFILNIINKFPKDDTVITTEDRYFAAGTSKSDLISKAAAVKVSVEKSLIKKQVDDHWAVIQSICSFKDKTSAYAFFFGMATRESTFRGATETGGGSAHAFGPIQTAETAYANADPSYMPETNVPEMTQYNFADDTFYDIGMSLHMGIRHFLHFARLAKEKYSGKDILRHALMGYNTGWIDGSSEDWISKYADETASLAGWYLTNNHMSDDEFTWDMDPRVNRSNPWSWY